MLILDTNILSSIMKPAQDEIIINWLGKLETNAIWITSISVFEIKYGIELLPSGKRKESLNGAFKKMLFEKFYNKILEVNEKSAELSGLIASEHKKSGRNIDIRDSLIAGIALSNDAFLATRNEKDFQHTDVKIINPWAL